MMNNILEKFILDTEDVFEETIESENNELKNSLTDLLSKLPELKSEEWLEIFSLMDSNSIGNKINTKEAYTVATSKIINGYAKQNKYLFAQYQKEMLFYNARFWTALNPSFLKEFLKTATNKIGIPEYIASSVSFLNKLEKQLIQDAYFEKSTNKDKSYINLKNGTLTLGLGGVTLENHHPKYFHNYIFDFEYLENEKEDIFLDTLKNALPSIDMQKTFQQAISQFIVKNFFDGRKVCLYGLNEDILDDFILILKEVIPHDLIATYFNNDKAQLEDLFINFENIKKDKKTLEKVIFISFENLRIEDLPKNLISNKSAILNWLLDGAKEIIKNKQLYISIDCEVFKERFNIVKLFVEESKLLKTSKNSKSIVTTYENVLKQYESFCELHDEEPIGRGTFNKELKALGFESTRRESGNVWFAKFA